MPSSRTPCSMIAVKAFPPGVYSLGGVPGLRIKKTSQGAGYYFLRYVRPDTGKKTDLTLGSYPSMSLADARKAAQNARDLIVSGIDPIDERQKEKAARRQEQIEQEKAASVLTFKDVALIWLDAMRKDAKWIDNWRGEDDTLAVLNRHVFPVIGHKDAEELLPKDIYEVLRPIWQNKHETAKKAKRYIKHIIAWARAAEVLECNEKNPAASETLKTLLEPLNKGVKEKENFASCSVEELPRLVHDLHELNKTSAYATEFAILTVARSQAVRFCELSQIDFEKRIWEIPPEKNKKKERKAERTIYLSDEAIELLRFMQKRMVKGDTYVFANRDGNPFSAAALEKCLKDLHKVRKAQDGIGWIDPVLSKLSGEERIITPHASARSTFQTWFRDFDGNNKKFDQSAVDRCLLHNAQDKYNGAYDRSLLAEERRAIMAAWGKYCKSYKKGGDIVKK